MPETYHLLPQAIREKDEIDTRDWRLGAVSGAPRKVLRPDRNWKYLLPPDEFQSGVYFDSFGCVTFSGLNCLEILLKYQGIEENLSDRFAAKLNGTTEQGNSLEDVAQGFRNIGNVQEERWPFPRTQRTPVFDRADYYSDIPEDIIAEGKKWASEGYEVNHEWVGTTPVALWEALQYAPVQVTVLAWLNPINGVFPDDPTKKRNHAVTLYWMDDNYYYIFDHYDKSHKILFRDHKIGAAKLFHITPKQDVNMPNTLTDNMLVQDVQHSGAFGMPLNGNIMIGPAAEVLATVIMRSPVGTNGEVVLKRKGLTKEEWDSFPKVNLKNEPIA